MAGLKRRGVALLGALVALIILGGLVATGLLLGDHQQQMNRDVRRQQQAFSSAEGAAYQAVSQWPPAPFNGLPVGVSLTWPGLSVDGRGWYRQTVHRLNQYIFLVRVEGFSRDSVGRQHLGILVRLRPLPVRVSAALTAAGMVRIRGASLVDGTDTRPEMWGDCPEPSISLPAVRLPTSELLHESACDEGCVMGSAGVVADSSLTESNLWNGIAFDSLKQFATKVLPPGTYQAAPSAKAGQCDTTVASNWGDGLRPQGACGSFFPVVWVEGDARIDGIQGQGVLLVDGDVVMTGGLRFRGLVLARGALRTQGSGAHIMGAVLVRSASLDERQALQEPAIRYSSCATTRALLAAARATPLAERSWANLH